MKTEVLKEVSGMSEVERRGAAAAFYIIIFAMILVQILWMSGTIAYAQDHAVHDDTHPSGLHKKASETVKQAPRDHETAAKRKAEQEEAAITITLSDEKRQLIGVRTAAASYRSLDRQVRTVGKVDVDETRLAFVNTKISGWVERLYVDYTGREVKKGEPLLSVYSPELVSAQEEYLLALKASRSVVPSRFGEIAESQVSLLESAKRRLLLWDIAPEQIAELEKSGVPRTEMTIYSPIDGIVMEKMVLEGGYIMPGMNLYKIADLTSVWVIGDIYEYEAPLVKIGQNARVSLAYFPGEAFDARVSYIYPTLDPMTRTIKVRLEVKNPELKLKPEMFADVIIMTSPGGRLTIPKEAVLDSGLRRIVYVEKKPGVYEMREVELGLRGDTYVEVLSGVRKGERVVTSGNFLIDSESQLRAGPGGGGHQH